jgi:hypothetical protein
MFNEVKINELLTREKFGYYSTEIKLLDRKCVIVECTCCHRIIERELRNAFRKHQCPIVEGNKKKCFKCNSWKDLSLFNKNKNLSGGVAKMCRECHNNHDSVKRCEKNRLLRKRVSFDNDLDLYLKLRVGYIKNSCKIRQIPFNIDFDYIKKMWEDQGGLCYYSNLQMKSEGRIKGFQSWNAPSLDRKNPSLGYVKGNVAWCCFSINSFKQNLTAEEFIEKLKNISWRDQV